MPQVNSLENPTQTLNPVSEVGTKEDLGKNVSAELAKDYKPVEERVDYQVAGKTAEEIQADIRNFREQIKFAESRDNEKMVLENEAKLRVAEQLLIGKQEQTKNESEIITLREEIKKYRENIKFGESRDNERIVLENEAKLREVEKKIATLSNAEQPVATTQATENNAPTKTTSEAPKKKKGFFSKLFGLGSK